MSALPGLPRVWVSIDLPGYREDPTGHTYGMATYPPYGFTFDEGEIHPDYDLACLKVFDSTAANAVVCSEPFSEFSYRSWIENETFIIRTRSSPLPAELRRYAEHYTGR